jgi:HD domain-containing protein
LKSKTLIKEAENLISSLYSLYKIRHLYPTTHPTFAKSISPAMESLKNVLSSLDEAVFLIVEKEFIFESEPLFRSRPLLQEFTENFEQIQIQRFTFQHGISENEIISLINILNTPPQEILSDGGFETIRQEFNLDHILLERFATPSGAAGKTGFFGGGATSYNRLPPVIRRQYGSLYDNTRTIFGDMARSEVQDLNILIKQIDHTVDEFYSNLNEFLDTFHAKKMTFGDLDHNVNTSALTMAFTKAIGFDKSVIKRFALAALLHDVGKLSLPKELQTKPLGLLTSKEMELYRQHPLNGAERLLPMQNVPYLAVIVCYEHHIGYDRKGFPEVSEKKSLHMAGYLISIVEKYETTVRLSPQRLSPEDYISELKKHQGSLFEPTLFDLFSAFITQV